MNKLVVPMERINLQDIYNKGDWRKKFEGYKKQVTKFRSLVEENKTWGEEDLSDLIYVQRNSIANNGQGVVSKTEFEKIKGKWTSLLAIIKETVSANDITDEQYNNFINIIYECCEKQKKVAANRIIAAFLPGVVTATVNEKDFNLLSKNLRNDFEDYPTPTGNWLSDNKSFIKFCREHLNFVDPWESSLFAWEIKLYYDGKNKETKGGNEMNMESEDILVELLLSNHNLILTGAPGTGKTYLAKQIAQQLIFGEVKKEMTDEEKKQFNEQCGFVQFHPSYDYTDFVEGLRPVKSEDENGVFERKDGCFKAFCKKAIVYQRTNVSDNFDEAWEKLVDYLNDNDFINVPFLSDKSKTFRTELNEYGTGLASRTYQDGNYQKGEWIKGQSKFFSKDQLYNVYKGLPGVPSGGHDNYRKAVVEKMKESFNLIDYKAGSISSGDKKPFVFIIDEINRGEISKIFGELFFSIDPGYRGIKGKVETQYQNLIKEDDDFYEGFYVPENVYIIGTMNDIDRSVESMDFAFRRRFAFKEVTDEDSQEMLDNEDAWKDSNGNSLKPDDETIKLIKGKMESLNKMIWHEEKENEKEEDKCIEGLSSAYHIGASYFLKLKNYKSNNGKYDNNSFDDLWKYHLKGLLFEYLRGMQGVEDSMNKLKKAYDSNNTTTNGSDSNNG